jgi:hypothetical protein
VGKRKITDAKVLAGRLGDRVSDTTRRGLGNTTCSAVREPPTTSKHMIRSTLNWHCLLVDGSAARSCYVDAFAAPSIRFIRGLLCVFETVFLLVLDNSRIAVFIVWPSSIAYVTLSQVPCLPNHEGLDKAADGLLKSELDTPPRALDITYSTAKYQPHGGSRMTGHQEATARVMHVRQPKVLRLAAIAGQHTWSTFEYTSTCIEHLTLVLSSVVDQSLVVTSSD